MLSVVEAFEDTLVVTTRGYKKLRRTLVTWCVFSVTCGDSLIFRVRLVSVMSGAR